jgi:hypothetical protein
MCGLQVQRLRNEQDAGNVKIDWDALWRNSPAYLKSLDMGNFQPMDYTPPQFLQPPLSKTVSLKLLQVMLFFENWPCMYDGPGPDPKIYGSLDASNRWCNWMSYGPLVVRVTEPNWMLTPQGHVINLDTMQDIFTFENCRDEVISNDQPFWAKYGGVEGTPAPVSPWVNLSSYYGKRTFYYIVPMDVINTFKAETPSGILPYPVGAKKYDTSVKTGDVVAMHILSQMEQTTFGYFDVRLPPIPGPGENEVGPPDPSLYNSYFPVVLRAWPIIRKLVQQKDAELDRWTLACKTNDLPQGLIANDPFPSPMLVWLDAFTSASQLVNPHDAFYHKLSTWYGMHPEFGLDATDEHGWFYHQIFTPWADWVNSNPGT